MKRMTGSEEMEPSSSKPVGVLAFGSLIWDPGCLQEHIIAGETRDARTPWPVEYARKSTSRGCAPTVVRVNEGGRVSAKILILDICDEETARSIVACREGLSHEGRHKIKHCRELECEHNDLAAVFYAGLKPNICGPDLCAEELATLAVGSFEKLEESERCRKNGIRYLRKNIEHGVVTALTCEYKRTILEKCGKETLKDAEEACIQGRISRGVGELI